MTASPEVRAAIRADYAAGDSLRTVGTRYGYHFKTVQKWLKADGIPLRGRLEAARAATAWAPEVREAAVADYADGDTREQIGARYGVSPSTVHKWAKDAGIGRPDPLALAGGRWVFSPARRVQVWEAS